MKQILNWKTNELVAYDSSKSYKIADDGIKRAVKAALLTNSYNINKKNLGLTLLQNKYTSKLKSIEFKDFKLKKGRLPLKNLKTAHVSSYKWYRTLFNKIKAFFAPDISQIKIRALKAWHDPVKLSWAHADLTYKKSTRSP